MKRKKKGGFQKKSKDSGPNTKVGVDAGSTDLETSELDKTFEDTSDIANEEIPFKMDATAEEDSDMEISFNLSKSNSTLNAPVCVSPPKKKLDRKSKVLSSKSPKRRVSKDEDSTKTLTCTKSDQEYGSEDPNSTETPRSTRSGRSVSINEQKHNSISEKADQSVNEGVKIETDENLKTIKGSKKEKLKGKLAQVQPLQSDQTHEPKSSLDSGPLNRRSTRNSSVFEPTEGSKKINEDAQECNSTDNEKNSKPPIRREKKETQSECADMKSEEVANNQKSNVIEKSPKGTPGQSIKSGKSKPGRKSKLELEKIINDTKNDPSNVLNKTGQNKATDEESSPKKKPGRKPKHNHDESLSEQGQGNESGREDHQDLKVDIIETSDKEPKHFDIEDIKVDQIIDDLESLESSQSEEEEWCAKKKSPKKGLKKGKKGKLKRKSHNDLDASEESSKEVKSTDTDNTPEAYYEDKNLSPKKKPGRKPKQTLNELKITELLEEPMEANEKGDDSGDELKNLDSEENVEEKEKEEIHSIELEISDDRRNRKEEGMKEILIVDTNRKHGTKPKKKPGRKSKQGFNPIRASSPISQPKEKDISLIGRDVDKSIEAEKLKYEERTPMKYKSPTLNKQGSENSETSPKGSGRRGKKRKSITPAKGVVSSFIEKFNEMFSDPIQIPKFHVVQAIEADSTITPPKKKRGRPKGSPNKSPRRGDPQKVPVKFMLPKNDMNDDKNIKTGGEDYLPKNFKLIYNGESRTKVGISDSLLDIEKQDLDDEEHEVDLDTGDEIIVKPESSVLSPVKTRKISEELTSSNLELANKAEDIEVEVTSAISKTLKLVTPGFISSENCDKVMELIPNQTLIEKIMFGYFFWVIVDEKSHTFEAIKAFQNAGYESVAYCHEDDLNKLCKAVVLDTPTFDDPDRVLLVYSSSIVLLRDIEHIKSIYQDSILITFSKFCFIECKSMLNSLNLHKILHENDKSDFGHLKCYKVNSSFNYQTYSARSPHKAKVSKERETMRKTLDLYELQKGDHSKALLLLGQAVKNGNKSKDGR